MALWVTLVIAMFLFLMVANLTMLSHGEMNQLVRSEAWIRCDIATRSIYEDLVADLRTAPWEKRPFRAGPLSRSDAELDGVRYHALIEDTRGAERHADIWISADREGAKRVVFHRIQVHESVFQKMNRIDTVFFSRFNPDEFGEAGGVPALLDRVERILERRAAKQAETDGLCARVQGVDDFNRIMGELGLPVTGSPATVQTPFAPGAKTGYAQNPALLSFATLDLETALFDGRLAVDSFRTVQGEEDGSIDAEFAKGLVARLGDRKATSILDKVGRLDFAPGAGERLLLPEGSGGADGLDLGAVEGFLLEAGAASGEGDSADGSPPADEAAAPDPGGDDPAAPADADPAPAGTTAGAGGEPDAPDAGGGDAAEAGFGDGTDGTTGDPADAGAIVYSFDDLVSKRDLFDEKFVEKWDDRKGNFGTRRSIAAFMHSKSEKYRLKDLMHEGKAEMADFERYIRAQNTLSRYSIMSYDYDRDRAKVIQVARDYFTARRGGVIDHDGASKL